MFLRAYFFNSTPSRSAVDITVVLLFILSLDILSVMRPSSSSSQVVECVPLSVSILFTLVSDTQQKCQ